MDIIGIHVNDVLDDSYIRNIKNKKIFIIQFFVNIENMDLYIKNKNKIRNNNILYIIHSNLKINVFDDWSKYSESVHILMKEIQISDIINAIGLIIHVGKINDKNKNKYKFNMLSLLNYINHETKKYNNIKIIIETPSSNINGDLYDINKFIQMFKKINMIDNDRFGICIDTAHIYVSGIDITKKKNIDNFFMLLKKKNIINKIMVVHLNDSKYECGSFIDKHENILKGKIGKNLIYFSEIIKKYKIPIILETPIMHIFNDLKILI
jgi:deoxyribonuclease IV